MLMDYTWMTLMIAHGLRITAIVLCAETLLFVLIVRTFRNTTASCALKYDYSNMMIVYGLGFTSKANQYLFGTLQDGWKGSCPIWIWFDVDHLPWSLISDAFELNVHVIADGRHIYATYVVRSYISTVRQIWCLASAAGSDCCICLELLDPTNIFLIQKSMYERNQLFIPIHVMIYKHF